MQPRARLYLLWRRLYWTRRFRKEFAFAWRYCWDIAGRNQNIALLALEVEREAQIERAEFEASVLDDLERLTLERAI